MDKQELLLLYSRMQRVHLLSDTLHMYASHICELIGSVLSSATPNIPEEIISQYVADINGILNEITSVQSDVSKGSEQIKNSDGFVQ